MKQERDRREPGDIHAQVDRILAAKELEGERMSVDLVGAAMRLVLTATHGPLWQQCSVEKHRLPSGELLEVASIVCPRCNQIESFIAIVDANGGFAFAAPIE